MPCMYSGTRWSFTDRGRYSDADRLLIWPLIWPLTASTTEEWPHEILVVLATPPPPHRYIHTHTYTLTVQCIYMNIQCARWSSVGSNPTPTRGSSFFFRRVTALGVLLCFVVCMPLLASFFLSFFLSSASLIDMYKMYIPRHSRTMVQ